MRLEQKEKTGARAFRNRVIELVVELARLVGSWGTTDVFHSRGKTASRRSGDARLLRETRRGR